MDAHYCYECMSRISEKASVCPKCHAKVPYVSVDWQDCPPGTILQNRYLTGRLIGRGGFGATYLALDLQTDQVVCIKEYFLRHASLRNPAHPAMITAAPGKEAEFEQHKSSPRREWWALSKLQDIEGVVRLLDAFEANNSVYIVLEYLPGCNLKTYVDDGRAHMNQREIILESVKTTISLLDILRHVHNRMLLHRDIKPANVFVLPDRHKASHGLTIRLIDFGSAREIHTDFTSLGTPGMCAPEAMLDNVPESYYTDIYGVGTLLYYMLVGSKPVPDGMGGMQPPPESKSTPELTRIFMKATNANPLARYQSAVDMREDLRAAFNLPQPGSHPNLLRNVLIGSLSVTAASLIGLILLAGTGTIGEQDARATYAPAAYTAVPTATPGPTPTSTASPTPSPVPVVINANAGEWAYCLPGEDPMMVTGSIAAPIVDKLAEGQLVRFGVSTEQGRAPEGVELRLMRDGYKLDLDLSSGAASIELTRGSYRLLVIDQSTGLELNSLPVELTADAEKQLDVEPYEYYAAHLANNDPSSFYYISDAETPLKAADVLRLNEWADELPDLFGDYRQFEVSFRITEGIPADAVVTINGHVWNKRTETTFTGAATPVAVRITTKDGSLILEESFTVEAVAKPEYVLGQSEADAYTARWEGVTGLLRVAGKGYKQMKDESDPVNALATVVVPVTDDDWNRMIADTQMYPDKKQYAPRVVTLKVPDHKFKAGAVEWVTIDGVQLVPDPDSQGMVYTVEISTGIWWIDGSLKGDWEHDGQALYVLDSFDEYDIDVFNRGYTNVLTYSFYSFPGFVQRLDGTVDYILSDVEAKELIPAEEWLGYAACYNIDGAFNQDWTMHPVSITIDPRVRVEPEKLFVRLDGYPIDLIEVDGVWTVNVSAVTGTNHNVWVYVTYENGETESFAWPVMYGTEMILLKGQADAWEAALRYESINGEMYLLAGDPEFLTEEALMGVRPLEKVETTLTIANPADWKPLTFALRPAGVDMEPVSIGTMTDGSVSFTTTIGKCEVWVLADETGKYGAAQVATIYVGGGETIMLDDGMAALGSEYRVRQLEPIRIPVDRRIMMSDATKVNVLIDFAKDDYGAFLDNPVEGEDGCWYVPTTAGLADGEYVIVVDLTAMQYPGATGFSCTYKMTFADNVATYTDANGNQVPALLSDVADAAQASACWWGLTPDTLELLPGSKNPWMLTEEAQEETRENAKLVYLKYPMGTVQVSAYTNLNWEFMLLVEIDGQLLEKPLPQGVYHSYSEQRYQPMYLSEGAEYRLVAVVPSGNTMKEFDLGGIVITAANVETRPGVNDKLMLIRGEDHKDGSPVVELVLGYYDKDHADFGGENAAPASKPAVTPAPAPEQHPGSDDTQTGSDDTQTGTDNTQAGGANDDDTDASGEECRTEVGM